MLQMQHHESRLTCRLIPHTSCWLLIQSKALHAELAAGLTWCVGEHAHCDATNRRRDVGNQHGPAAAAAAAMAPAPGEHQQQRLVLGP
jgi:hypothetical protein